MGNPIYKILSNDEWQQAQREGVYRGSAVDTADGFIHFSTASQVAQTAAKHFHGRDDLLLLSVDADGCDADALRWEASRGGALFPHLYTQLQLSCVQRVDPLPLESGIHRFPEHLHE